MKLPIFLAASLLVAPLAFAQNPAPTDHVSAPVSMEKMEKKPVPPSKFLNIVFQGHTTTLTLTDLATMPQVTVHVHNEHSKQDETYSGPLVSDVLAKAGLTVSPETQPLILHSAVVATGSDNYFVIYSLAELEPAFSLSKSIVAVMKSGLPDTDGGLIQLINTDGAKPARWVHGLANLNIMSVAVSR